jgi:ribosomal protein S18 acetylase RimI-like enzyme
MSGTQAAARAIHADVARVAALHRACLPDSILSALGDAGVARYYAYALGSPHEHAFVVRDAGSAVAACVLSTAPHTMLRRFALHAPGALARELAGGLIASPPLRRRLGARLAEAARAILGLAEPVRRSPQGEDRARSRVIPAAVEPALPEVTQIFTDPAHRGRGLGAILLGAAESVLRATGHRAYCIHTLRDDNDAGIRFYRREGFSQAGTARSFGDHYLVMTKELT